jgi:hypothetical protein
MSDDKKKDYLFIALGGKDGFLDCFAYGSNAKVVARDAFVYEEEIDKPIAFRGISKGGLITRCWKDHRDFYFMDTGYFGNYVSSINPKGQKRWHRIVKNNVQHLDTITYRPDDRWNILVKEFPRLEWTGWKKTGSKILVVVPSEKPCKFYGINATSWLENTINTLKTHTDRELVIRTKAPIRTNRSMVHTIYDAMDDDIFALVTYNSIAATEAVAYGIPAFALAPNAASSVCLNDLSKIETPYYPDYDKVHQWCCYLSYGQFSVDELANGTAWRILNEYN